MKDSEHLIQQVEDAAKERIISHHPHKSNPCEDCGVETTRLTDGLCERCYSKYEVEE